jgi:hypothetical protein
MKPLISVYMLSHKGDVWLHMQQRPVKSDVNTKQDPETLQELCGGTTN